MKKQKSILSEDQSGGLSGHLKRFFGDLEVIDGKTALRVQPNADDIKAAVRDDPANCAFSKACQRVWSSRSVLFFGTIAYVDLLGEDGVRRIERFKLPAAAQRYINDFDSGKAIPPAGFILSPPSSSQTLDGMRSANRAFLARKASLKGHSKGSPKPRGKPKTVRLNAFRQGTGMVQFPRAS